MPEPEVNTSPVTPKASPLPPRPAVDPLTAEQWKTLLAVADTVIPSIAPASLARPDQDLPVHDNTYSTTISELQASCLASGKAEIELAKQYLAEKPSDNPLFKEILYRLFGFYLPSDVKQQFLLSLNLLNSRPGSALFTGYFTPFHLQPVATRQAILQSWASARIPNFRLLFKSLTLLMKQNWAKSSPTLGRVLNFPRVPVHGKPSPGFPFEFLQLPPGEEPAIMVTEVLVVGSGCGGGVVARNLAETGLKVLVVDKGYYWPAEHLPMTEADAFVHLLLNSGSLISEDSSSCVIAGQTWGGGGTVNWSACLQTQGYVRSEWANTGLPLFTSSEFQQCLDTVFSRMGVSAEHIHHNKGNHVLLEGSRKLGWAAKPVAQNTNGKQHYCGYCSLGCGSCEKQGPAVSYLPEAARNGATFMEGFDVDKVLFAKNLGKDGKQIATGVVGTWISRDEHGGVAGSPLVKRKVYIYANRVVISASTMQSPLILQRSGIRNPHVGGHLKLHPVSFIGAVYDTEVKPWEGGILTSVVSEFENLDGYGHGPKLESVTMLPATWLSFPVWLDGFDYKTRLAPRMKNMVGHFALQRDIAEGQVYADPVDGRPRFRYHPSRTDKQHIMEGLVALAKINYIEGAREIFCTVPGVPRFVRRDPPAPSSVDQQLSGIDDPDFVAWLTALRARGFPHPDSTFVSAHQMGTCRMAASAKKGVVDMRGRVFGTERLYVADASVFPSASGVNPMVTNMAIAEWISRGLARELQEQPGTVDGEIESGRAKL